MPYKIVDLTTADPSRKAFRNMANHFYELHETDWNSHMSAELAKFDCVMCVKPKEYSIAFENEEGYLLFLLTWE
jgi:hypothetical protein